jgi:hypothetical protein
MRSVEWRRTVRGFVPSDEGWEFVDSFCYRPPVRRVLLGALGEGSAFDKNFYIWRLKMPIFIPSQHVNLSWSERMGGKAHKFDADDEETVAAAIGEAIAGLGTEEDTLVEIAAKGAELSSNRRVSETVGYAHLLLGDLQAAEKALKAAEAGSTRSQWEQEIIERTQLVRRLLKNEGHDRAVRQLDLWCQETATALRLRGHG